MKIKFAFCSILFLTTNLNSKPPIYGGWKLPDKYSHYENEKKIRYSQTTSHTVKEETWHHRFKNTDAQSVLSASALEAETIHTWQQKSGTQACKRGYVQKSTTGLILITILTKKLRSFPIIKKDVTQDNDQQTLPQLRTKSLSKKEFRMSQ